MTVSPRRAARRPGRARLGAARSIRCLQMLLPWLALGAVAPGCQAGDEDNPAPVSPFDQPPPLPDYRLPDAGRPDAARAPDAFVGPATPVLNEVDCRGSGRVELADAFAEGAGGDLTGFWLTDGKGGRLDLTGLLPPGGHLDFTAPFRIDCGVTTLALMDPAGQALETLVVPVAPAAVTYGRLPDREGAFAACAPTPAAANRAPQRPAPSLLDPRRIVDLDLTLPDDSMQVLRNGAEVVVDADLRLDDRPVGAVGVRLTGEDGRYRSVHLKPTLELRFDHPDATMAFEGVTGVVAHSAALDPTVVGQHLGARLLGHAGLNPPATGFARITLNGEPYGLYALIERYDGAFAARHHPSTFALYSDVGRELTADQLERIDFIAGERSTRPVLRWLVQSLDEAPADGFLAATEDRVDWPQVWRAFAVERWMQSGDGYAGAARALTLHVEASERITLWPDALDRLFRGPASPFARGGRLFFRCLTDPACRQGYALAFAEVAQALAAATPALDAELARLEDLLAPEVAADWRSQNSPEMFAAGVAELRFRLGQRAVAMADEAACLRAGEDADGDGWICSADCAPEDAAVHPLAEEICGDGQDNDCDGSVDVATACPACSPITRGGRTYQVCTGALDWPAARLLCFERGLELARIDSWGENAWLLIQARALAYQGYWIGLNDRTVEGTFEWDDLSLPGETFWGDGQPDDGGGDEDCVQLRPEDARWNDLGCAARLGYLCEPRCPAERDADGDGFGDCGADCDDADPAVGPGAEETCDDDVDNDCDGVIDEGPGCDACRTRVRGDRTYLICPQGADFDTAVAECAARGAALVTIEDAAENAWLYTTARRVQYQRYWLGLTQRDRTGDWRTLDGERPRYTAWTRGEPNDSGGVEKCAHLWEWLAGWNDIGCDAQHGFICERATAP